MRDLLEIVLSNAAVATVLALLAMIVGRYCRRPAVVYGCWFLVLLKLVTPSVVRVPISFITLEPVAEPVSAIPRNPVRQSKSASQSNFAGPEVAQESIAAWKTDESPASMGGKSSIQSRRFSDRGATRDAADGRLSPSRRIRESDEFSAPAVSRSTRHHVPWGEWALSLWAAGSIVFFSVMTWRLVRFSRVIGRLGPVEDDLQRQADILARRFGLAQSPAVKLVSAPVPPILWAMCRPATILLPRALVARLSPQQQNSLLAHELAHYRRHDHWVRWFEVVILGLYWWHPVAWIARRELQRAEEQCCDAWVLWALPEAGQAYARAILETVDFLTADYRPAPALASGLGPVHLLERRLEMILHAQPKHRVGIIAKCALILLAVVVLPLSAEAQFSGEPVKPDTARGQQTPKAPTQHRLPENTLQLTTAPVAIEGPTEKTVPVDPNSLSGSHPITGTPAVGPGASNSNDTEDRLARVEKLVQTILAEMHGQQQRHHVSVLGIKAGSSDATGGGVESVSLSDLKKQRIDLEDELESIKDRMDKVDAQIAKLQSARSSKLPSNDSFQVK